MKTFNEIFSPNEAVILVDTAVIDQLLIEATEDKKPEKPKKLTHLAHLEDMMIVGGSHGFAHSIEALEKTHDYLKGQKRQGFSVKTKFDGSPSVIFGHDPQTKKFFVGTKSYFNKTPKVNYTDKDVDANHGAAPQLAKRLKFLLQHLKKVAPKEGIFQGDLMYTSDDVSSDGKNVSFTPNTLTYNVDKNSYQGQKILKSKMGLAVHTQYRQTKNENQLEAAFDHIDMSKFNPSDDVYFLQTDLRGPFAYNPKEMKSFNEHLMKAKQLQGQLEKNNSYEAIKDHETTLLSYINQAVRAKKPLSVEGYISHLYSQLQKKSQNLKFDKTKERIRGALDDEVKNITQNKSNFDKLFRAHNHVQNAKNVLVGALSKNSPYNEQILGNKSKPEGFVVSVNGHPVKMIDREHFSAANFDWNDKVDPAMHPVVMNWGRFNPVHTGHEKALGVGQKIANKIGAKHITVASRSQNPKTDPLTPQEKLRWMKMMFPGQELAVAAPDQSTLIAQLQHLHLKGTRDLTLVVGQDRVKDFQNILAKYNGPDKPFHFARARVVSAGARDPEAKGTTGMSGHKMRDAAKAGDFKTFKSGVPAHVKPKEADEMFHTLRKSMGVVQIGPSTSGHALSIYAKHEDDMGNKARIEIERRKRSGTWKGA